MKNTSSHLLLGAVGLLATNSPLISNQATATVVSEAKMTAINVASLKSMESTWLKVPMACKARGINADATSLVQKAASQDIQAIYASYEA